MKAKEEKDIHEFIASLNDEKVTYNPELDRNDNEIIFKEKVKKGRETIARIGMPKAYYEQYKKEKP